MNVRNAVLAYSCSEDTPHRVRPQRQYGVALQQGYAARGGAGGEGVSTQSATAPPAGRRRSHLVGNDPVVAPEVRQHPAQLGVRHAELGGGPPRKIRQRGEGRGGNHTWWSIGDLEEVVIASAAEGISATEQAMY